MTDYNDLSHELDWDDVIENDSTFTLLPDGVYPFTVTGFERARHPGSAKLPPCNKAIVSIEVDGGQLGKTTIKHNLFLHSKCEGLLCSFFTALGFRQHGQQLSMPWNKITGARGWCKVGVHKWTSDRTKEEMESNEIKQFLPPDKAPAQAAPAAPTAAPTSGWTPGNF